jgi:hypothetical protein
MGMRSTAGTKVGFRTSLFTTTNSKTVIFPVDFKKNGHIIDDVCFLLICLRYRDVDP